MTVGGNVAVLVWLLAGFVAVATVAVVALHGDRFRDWVGTPDDVPARPEQTGDGEAAPSGDAESESTLSDEERILQMLDENDGRLWQRDIHEQTEWSKSKVSRLLSTMEGNGKVRKIAIGRENIITLPGAEPELAQSGIDR